MRNRTCQAIRAARLARKAPSVAEKIMWNSLRDGKIGFKFRREHPIGPYRLDFYCDDAKLAVELDGEQHDSAKDAVRDTWMEGQGIFTYRIPNRQFFNLDEGPYRDEIAEIIRLCEARTEKSKSEDLNSEPPRP